MNDMNVKDAFEKRWSIRKFKKIDISDDRVEEVIRRARLAPSAGNIQAFKVVVSRGWKLTNIKSPVSLVVCAVPEESAKKYGDRGRNLYSVQDATIFAAYLQLAALDMGLASVWVGAFNESKVKEKLGLGKELRPIAIIQIGHPAIEKSGEKKRKKVEEIIWKN